MCRNGTSRVVAKTGCREDGRDEVRARLRILAVECLAPLFMAVPFLEHVLLGSDMGFSTFNSRTKC